MAPNDGKGHNLKNCYSIFTHSNYTYIQLNSIYIVLNTCINLAKGLNQSVLEHSDTFLYPQDQVNNNDNDPYKLVDLPIPI